MLTGFVDEVDFMDSVACPRRPLCPQGPCDL